MATIQEAKKLCTKDEFYWVEWVMRGNFHAATVKELHDALQVLRKLKTKFRDLEKTQRLKAKRSPKAHDPRDFFGDPAAERTSTKRELFAELLTDIENELSTREPGVESTEGEVGTHEKTEEQGRSPGPAIARVRKRQDSPSASRSDPNS